MPPEKPSRYIPINEIDSPVVSINIPFPIHCDTSRIGVDIARLEMLCKIAGISELNIGTMKYDSMETDIQILGTNRDGSAVGGAIESSQKSESQHRMQENEGYFKFQKFANTSIELNMRKLTDAISRHYPEGAGSVAGWVDELNAIIKKEIMNQGGKFLLSFRSADIVHDSLVLVFSAMIGMLIAKNSATPVNSISEFMIETSIEALALINSYGLVHELIVDKNTRASLISFGGYELDRALILLGVVFSTRQLVAEIKPEIEE